MKLSEVAYKRTIPGIQQVKRFVDGSGCPVGDVIYDETMAGTNCALAVNVTDSEVSYDFGAYEGRDLLVQMVDGRGIGERPTLAESRRACREALMRLDPGGEALPEPAALSCGRRGQPRRAARDSRARSVSPRRPFARTLPSRLRRGPRAW